MKTIYIITANTDLNDGSGSDYPVAVTESRKLAFDYVGSKAYAHKYGVQGYPGSDHNVRQAKLLTSADEFDKV